MNRPPTPRRSGLLLAFFLPVALFVLLISTGAHFSLNNLRAASSASGEQHNQVSARLAAVAQFNHELASLQIDMGATLEQASAGQISEGDIYLAHTRVVEQQVRLARLLADIPPDTVYLGALASARLEFETYSRLIIMASDLAAIDPPGAMRHAYAAAQTQLGVLAYTHDISSLLAQAASQRSREQAGAFQRQAETASLIGLGLVVALLLTWFLVARSVTERLSRLTEALSDLADDNASSAALPVVTALSHNRASLLQGMALAVLAFRDAVISRRDAQYALNERMKELACLFDINRMTERDDVPLAQMLDDIARRLPAAMRYPELCQASIVFGAHSTGAPLPADTATQATEARFQVHRIDRDATEPTDAGVVTLAYTAPLPAEAGDTAFLAEEQALLNAVASRLSSVIQRRTERQAEQETQLMVHTMMEQAPYAIYLVDPETLKFVQINATACKLLGYPRDELMHLRKV